MTIYLFLLAVVAVVGIAGSMNSIRLSRKALIALYAPAFAAMAIVAGLRWQTGWDWEAYDAMIAAAPGAPLGSNSGDFLFDIVVRLAAFEHISIYLICAFVIVIGFFWIASRWCPTSAQLSIALVFFLWYGYYGAWSTIRQGVSIVFFTIALLTPGWKVRWTAFAAAALFHRSACLPIAVYALYTLAWSPTSGSSRGKRVMLTAIAAGAIIARYRATQMAALFLDFSGGFFGASRTNSLATNTFFIEPYPLVAGRLFEILFTIFVLSRLARAASGDSQRMVLLRLYNLQILHLLVYLICSPITFIAERQVLFFDYIHCFALAYALVISGVYVANSKSLGWLRYLNRRNCLVTAMIFVMSLGYIANRYRNILDAVPRDPLEVSHHDRFIPYRMAP